MNKRKEKKRKEKYQRKTHLQEKLTTVDTDVTDLKSSDSLFHRTGPMEVIAPSLDLDLIPDPVRKPPPDDLTGLIGLYSVIRSDMYWGALNTTSQNT